jgi:HEPN domain-containing protein
MTYIPIHRRDFKALADMRADEAHVLLREGKMEGAYYLAGYAIECALKACIAKKTKKYQFPPDKAFTEKAYSHRLSELIKLAGLEEELDKAIRVSATFATSWSTVSDWTEQSRYNTSGLDGRSMYNAVVGKDGVLPWIKLHW